MVAHRTATLYANGPVRVTGAPGHYRIRWSEPGRDPERTAQTWERALDIADAEAARLALAGRGHVNGGTAFGALCEAWVADRRHRWTLGTVQNIESLLRQHVLPTVGKVACDRLTDTQLEQLVLSLRDAGYSQDHLGHVTRLLRSVGRYGVRRGVWVAALDPAQDIKVPDTVRLLDRTLVPSAKQVSELEQAVRTLAPTEDQAMRRAWLIRAAAGCGLRWGEAVVIEASDVNLATREVTVTRAMNERSRTIGLPKSRTSVRTVIIPDKDLPLWKEVVEATEDGPLGATLRGMIWRNSNWHQNVLGPAIEKVAGWPHGAKFHYLRHFAICSWLDRGLRIGNVSALAGHHSTDFTFKRYVGPSADFLDQARKLL